MLQEIAGLVADEFRDPFLSVSAEIAFLRVFFAAFLGAAIGFEREIHSSAAGLRTHIILAMAACLFALIAAEIVARDLDGSEQLTSDPLRLIEAVTAGVAFLAAGSIITSGGKITGLTTGAGMWMAGAIGLACGTGLIPLAVMATMLTVLVLWVLRRLSRRIAESGDTQEARGD
ncbi:MgtC/SapB family protein [Pseudogemmobacter sonorensis]|uniref:MgtC/SapB family protein n=1 Tax=Pseudogemmobacter sonorensis TaxID=2989681 RepID=UPI00369D7538